jgi:hypothetical protein
MSPRLAALEQQRASCVVAREQEHGPVPVPTLERVGLALALPVRKADLERGRSSVRVRANDMARRSTRVRLAERELPGPRALGHESRDIGAPVVVSQAENRSGMR